MQHAETAKGTPPPGREPNLADYDDASARFSWDAAAQELDGLPGGGLNIAHEAVLRHAAGPLADKVALRFLRKDHTVQDTTYAALADAAGRFAAVLGDLGLERGDRVFCLLGRRPELYVAAIGSLMYGAVFCPLFSAFGPEPIRQRLSRGNGRVLVTTAALHRKRVAAGRDQLPDLDHVLLVDGAEVDGEGVHDLAGCCGPHGRSPPSAPTGPEDPALLHFTSGSTGTPKGALHVHRAVVAHHATAAFALDLHQDDVFWCTADPGWVTGTSYGIVAPLTHGVTTIVDEAEFDADRWYAHPRRTARQRLVHRSHRGPHAHARRRRAAPERMTCPRSGSSRRWANPSTPTPWPGAATSWATPSTTTGGRPRPAGS